MENNAGDNGDDLDARFWRLINARSSRVTIERRDSVGTLLERKNNSHFLIQNQINEIVGEFLDGFDQQAMMINGFVDTLQQQFTHYIDEYDRKCAPIIEGRIDIPAPVLEEVDRVLQQQEARREFTVENFKNMVLNEVMFLLGNMQHENTLNHRCLDGSVDTEEQVETILRLYPEALRISPDILRCESIEAITFIPLIVRLRMELYPGDNALQAERGGLLTQVEAPEWLSEWLSRRGRTIAPGQMYNTLVFLALIYGHGPQVTPVLRRLRQMGLLTQEDIELYGLLHMTCVYKRYFSGSRFQFFVEWDPSVLLPHQRFHNRYTPLDVAAHSSRMQGFLSVFKAGLYRFPENGLGFWFLLFLKNFQGLSPFTVACERFGREEVLNAVERILDAVPPNLRYNPMDVILSAAQHQRIDLDCVYLVLRREPHILAQLLSEASAGAVFVIRAIAGLPPFRRQRNDGEDGRNVRQRIA